MSGRLKTLLFALALAAASLAVYHATLWNSFVYDDAEQVLRNRWITDARYLKDIFTSHTFAFAESSYQAISYRPLFMAFYMFEYALFGLDPRGWHLLNIILHSANAVAVFFLARRLLGAEEKGASFAAFAGALVFTVLPAGSEAVSWVGCAPELLYSFLCLVSFYVYAGPNAGAGRVAASAIIYLVAAFTKETAIIFPFFLYVYDSLRDGWIPGLSRIKRYAPFAVAAFAYIGVKSALLGHIAAPERIHTDLKGADFLVNAPYLFAGYLKALVFPAGVYPLQPFSPVSAGSGAFMLSIAVIAALAAFFFVFRKKIDRLSLLALAIFVVPLLPALYAPAISRTPFAERYLYFPSIGFALFIALVFQRTLASSGSRKTLIVALAATAAFYSVWSYKKSLVWRDDRALWGEALKGSQENYLALHSLGYIDFKEGRDAEAVDKLSTALKINLEARHPDPTMALLTRKVLANALQRSGLLDRAAKEYEEVLKYAPEDPVAGFNLGTIYESSGRIHDAIELYEKALYFAKRADLQRELMLRLGDGYASTGRAEEARAVFERGADAFPADPEFSQKARSLSDR